MASFDNAKSGGDTMREPKTTGWNPSDDVDSVATSRGWGAEDAGTSSPSDLTGTSSNFNGTAYDNQAPGGAAFTKENMTEPTAPQASTGPLSSIPGGKTKETGRSREGWENAAPKLNDLAQKAQDVASRAQDAVGEFAKQAQDFAVETIDNLRETVKEKPVQSLLVGFGVGCLIGALLPRR